MTSAAPERSSTTKSATASPASSCAAPYPVRTRTVRAPHCSTELDVARLVTDHERASGFEAQFARCPLDELGARLAATTGVVRAMRAVVDRVERHALGNEQLAQPGVNLREPSLVEEAATDRRLVRDDHETAPRGAQRPQSCDDAGQQHDLIGVRQVMHLRVEGAVTIEHDDRTTPPVIAHRRWVRTARR